MVKIQIRLDIGEKTSMQSVQDLLEPRKMWSMYDRRRYGVSNIYTSHGEKNASQHLCLCTGGRFCDRGFFRGVPRIFPRGWGKQKRSHMGEGANIFLIVRQLLGTECI